MIFFAVPYRDDEDRGGDVASKETMRFGSMKEMAGQGLALLEEDEIDKLFFKHADRIEAALKGVDHDRVKRLRVGVATYPPNTPFRGRSKDKSSIIIVGEQQDEVFYLVFSLDLPEKVPGGIAPGGPRMEIFLRDGCGRPGVESGLYNDVLLKFKIFLHNDLNCEVD